MNINLTIKKYYVFQFLRDFSFFSAVLIPFFTVWAGISMAQVAILQSWFMFWIFVLEIPTGVIADNLGRKYSLALGSLVGLIGVLVYSSIPKFEIFLLGEFLLAMCVALISGADEALIYDSLKEAGKESESKKVFGRAQSANLLGILIAAPIGSIIASQISMNAPMYFSAIPFGILFFLSLSFKEPKIHDTPSEVTRYLDTIKEGFKFLKNHKIVKAIALNSIIISSIAYFVLWLYQPIMISLDVPIVVFGYLHILLVLSEIIVSSQFERLEKLLGSESRYLNFTALVTGLSFIIVALFPSIITGILFLIIAGGLGLTRIKYISTYMNSYIPSAQRATILSSISMFNRLVLVIINPIVGFMIDRSLGITLLILGIIPFLFLLLRPAKSELFKK